MTKTRGYCAIGDLQRAAERRLPRIVREYIAGGASTEFTVRENREAFDRILLAPRILVDLSSRSTTTTVLGQRLSMPVIAGPAGLAPLVHRDGELAVVRAAGDAGTVFCVSNASGYSIEEIARHARGPLWFQLFSCTDRDIARQFLARARAAGCQAIILGVDLPIGGLRYRDERNGFRFPPRPRPRDVADFLAHPRWLGHVLGSRRVTLGNYKALLNAPGDALDSYEYLTTRVLTPACSWDDLAWLRQEWKASIVVKGIMSAPDAIRAADIGVDAIVVSNHGGRQLDWQPATIDVLPEIVSAVRQKTEVLIDGGIRHGTDVVKALALGARACLVARPWYWSLAAGGETGVGNMFRIFRHEIDNVIGLLGCPDVEMLSDAFVRRLSPLPLVGPGCRAVG